MAMACFGLVTFFPLRPDFSLPFFIACISRSTDLPAAGLYLRELEDLFDAVFFPDDFCVGDFFADTFFAEDEELFVDDDFLDETDFFVGLFFVVLFFFVAILFLHARGTRSKTKRLPYAATPYEAETVAYCRLSDAISITKRYFTSDLSTRS